MYAILNLGALKFSTLYKNCFFLWVLLKCPPVPRNCRECKYTYRYMLPPINSAHNTLRPRQNGRRFPDDTFISIFLKENVRVSIKISLKFVPKGPINNIQALVQIMAWRRSGDKPLSEPMMVSLLTHICVTRPQWDKGLNRLWKACISRPFFLKAGRSSCGYVSFQAINFFLPLAYFTFQGIFNMLFLSSISNTCSDC